jgi:hypothetical protein
MEYARFMMIYPDDGMIVLVHNATPFESAQQRFPFAMPERIARFSGVFCDFRVRTGSRCRRDDPSAGPPLINS